MTEFRLPPEVSSAKQRLADGWAYVFRHRRLGEPGRILVQDLDDGRTHISYEIAGDPDDPMTTRRRKIMEPIGDAIAKRLEAACGSDKTPVSGTPPKPPADPGERIETKLMLCRQCSAPVAVLFFAPAATDTGRFEDYARKLYPECVRHNVPAWIIGPALGSGPLDDDNPADILQIWPKRRPTRRLSPAEFNPELDELTGGHCQAHRAKRNRGMKQSRG